jgi:hypothetical protein
MLGDPNYTALLIQHGLTPVLADDPRPGTTSTAWLPFLFMTTDNATHLVFTYQRGQIDILGGGTIPPKTFSTPLPA